MNCPNCGNQVSPQDTYCSCCGARVPRPIEYNQQPLSANEQYGEMQNRPVQVTPSPAGSKNNKAIILSVVAIILALGLGYGIYSFIKHQNEETLWKACVTNKQIDDLRQYIEDYPDGEHYIEARELLGKLVNEKDSWEQAQSSNDEDYLRAFIRNNPGSKHIDEAKSLLDDVVWNKVVTIDTKEAYGQYLQEFSGGKHASDARSQFELKRRAELTSAERDNVKGTINTFLAGLENWNYSSMLSSCNSEMANFMGKRNASYQDVNDYYSGYRNSDIDSIKFSSLAVDVKKQINNDSRAEYQVIFTTTRTMWRKSVEMPIVSLIKGQALVDERFRFMELNMDKEGE